MTKNERFFLLWKKLIWNEGMWIWDQYHGPYSSLTLRFHNLVRASASDYELDVDGRESMAGGVMDGVGDGKEDSYKKDTI